MAYLRSWTSNLLCVACLATASCATGDGDSNIRDPGHRDAATTNTADRPGEGVDASVGEDTSSMGMQDVPPGSMDTSTPIDGEEQDTGVSELDAGMMSMPDTGVGPVDTGVIVTVPDTGVVAIDTGVVIVDSGVPTDTGVVPTDTGTPTDTGPAPLTCLAVIIPVTCNSSENCCISLAGVGAGCGYSPIPGFIPCLPSGS